MYRIICLIRVSRIHRNVIVKTKLLCLLIHFFFFSLVSRWTVQNSVAKHWKCFIDVTQFNIYVFNNESYFLTTLSYHRNIRIPGEASQSFFLRVDRIKSSKSRVRKVGHYVYELIRFETKQNEDTKCVLCKCLAH